MIKSEKSIIINRPIEEVWEFMSNVENVFQWDPEFLDLRLTTEGPTDIGSTVEYRRMFLGKRRTGTIRVSEYMLHRILTIQVDEKGITGRIRYTFEPVEGGTRLTGASEGEVSGWWKLITLMLIVMLEVGGRDDLIRVKRIMEAAASSAT